MSTIEEFYSRKLIEYKTIIEMSFTQAKNYGGPINQELRICLSKGLIISDEQLTIVFRGVRDLRYTPYFWSSLMLLSLDISRTETSYEEYLVTEKEDEIKFFCTSFEIINENGSKDNLE